MSAPTSFHLVTKADLASGHLGGPWDDPEGLLSMSPQKRQALLSNPLSDDPQDPVRILAIRESAVIGRQDIVVGRIRVRGKDLQCLWGSDLAVPEQFRSSLAGVNLVLQLQRRHHTVGACGISQMVYPVLQRLRWRDIPMPRYVLLRTSRPVVERFLPSGVASTISRVVLDTTLRAHGRILSAWAARKARGLDYERVEAMTPDMEPYLARADAPIAAYRSPAWINWLLANEFNEELPVRPSLYYVHDHAGAVLGYFLVKATTYPLHRGFSNVKVASLKDWMIFDTERLDTEGVILCAVEALSRWDVEVIEICLSGRGALPALRKWGFVRRGELHLMLKASSGSPLSEVAVSDQASELRPAEGDNFFA
jgi:hypothetical protein